MKKKVLTADELRAALLKRAGNRYGGKQQLLHKLSTQTATRIERAQFYGFLNSDPNVKNPPRALLNVLGLKEVKLYVPKNESTNEGEKE